MAGPGDAIASLRFRGAWRRYQQLALEAFERDRAAGRARTHVVAPPGSGKTLLGVELIRRLGAPALVLAPNTAIQAQWTAAVASFLPEGADVAAVAAASTDAPVACLTYQALCQLDDPDAAIGALAERRWAAERAAATSRTVAEVEREAAGLDGEARARRAREVSRVAAAVKREIARGEHHELGLDDLLGEGARARVDALVSLGVGTVVLDECHHLASLWGYVVRAVLERLPGVHLVGLTATPPDELTAEEEGLYEALLGEVDFTVPTPAVVKDGFLAPYQELAWLIEPLETERRWLAEHDLRFQELVTRLHDDEPTGPISFPAWVITRLRERGREGEEGEAVAWEDFQRRQPALARAGVRFLASGGLELPRGAPRGEGYRQPPDLDDWLVLLEDYALRCLSAEPSPEAASRYEAVAAALRDLGFSLTRRGIRRGASDVDRLLTQSAAKPIALVEILARELDARGGSLRALVLVDAELAPARADDALVGVLAPGAGTGRVALRAVADDARTAPLRPLLVTGRGLRCAEEDGPALLDLLGRQAAAEGLALGGWRQEPEDGLATLGAAEGAWEPRTWVGLATRAFAAGGTCALVGTRALLGEGWDAPCVNTLVDLTAAATAVSVRQMRGRSLRLDPADPDKLASNWDVVCVAPDLARGSADYARFVRKHLHLYAPAEDGAIEAGPSHVHPELGPFGPPPAERFEAIARDMAARAADRDAARARWRIGEPYAGEERETLLVRGGRDAGSPARPAESPPSFPLDQRQPLLAAGAAAIAGTVAGAAAPPGLVLLAGIPAALGWAASRLGRARRELPVAAPLDRVARAVADGLAAVAAIRPEAAASLRVEPRSSGYLRCWLDAATAAESDAFAAALDEALGTVDAPRYLVSRLVAPPGRGGLGLLARLVARRPAFALAWHAVPDELGRRKERAEAYAEAWRRWLGPAQLVFTQRDEAGRRALAEAAAGAEGPETLRRRVWS